MTKMNQLIDLAELVQGDPEAFPAEAGEVLETLLHHAWSLHFVLGHYGHRMIASLIQHAGPNMVVPNSGDIQQFSEAIEFLRHINQDDIDEVGVIDR